MSIKYCHYDDIAILNISLIYVAALAVFVVLYKYDFFSGVRGLDMYSTTHPISPDTINTFVLNFKGLSVDSANKISIKKNCEKENRDNIVN